VLADGEAYEYAVGSEVASNPALKPLSELDPPVVDPAKLNSPRVVELVTNAGLI
jgi:iron(III) transport system substrate-binding protein